MGSLCILLPSLRLLVATNCHEYVQVSVGSLCILLAFLWLLVTRISHEYVQVSVDCVACAKKCQLRQSNVRLKLILRLAVFEVEGLKKGGCLSPAYGPHFMWTQSWSYG